MNKFSLTVATIGIAVLMAILTARIANSDEDHHLEPLTFAKDISYG